MAGPAASTSEQADAEPRPTASGADLADVFARIPRVDAVRRRRFLGGLAGWGARQWVALVAASAVLAGLLGAFGPRVGWGPGWVAVVAVASVLGGFVLASAVPRPGTRFAWSSCSALPLVGTLLVPAILNPADPMTGVVGLGLLVALASRQAAGVGC